MCSPVAIAGAASLIEVGSSVAQYVGQGQQRAANTQSALQNQALQLQQLGVREAQMQAGTAQTIMQADRQARQASALSKVSAGEAGVSGVSVDMLLNNLERQREEYGQSAQRNLDNNVAQAQAEKLGVIQQTQARINQVPAPNPFALGLGIAGAGLQLGTGIYQREKRPSSAYGYPVGDYNTGDSTGGVA